MSIPTFIDGYPPDGSSLGQTKAVIRDNLDGTFLTVGVDHINNNGQPGMNPSGYHNVSHMVPQASDPSAVTGYGQLYSKTISSDQALFWETGNGIVQQLTANIDPTVMRNGYTFLPGGLILQWGYVVNATKNSVTAQLFNIPFPNNTFNLQGTSGKGNGATVTLTFDGNPPTLTPAPLVQFDYFVTASGPASINFFWMAIGN